MPPGDRGAGATRLGRAGEVVAIFVGIAGLPLAGLQVSPWFGISLFVAAVALLVCGYRQPPSEWIPTLRRALAKCWAWRPKLRTLAAFVVVVTLVGVGVDGMVSTHPFSWSWARETSVPDVEVKPERETSAPVVEMGLVREGGGKPLLRADVKIVFDRSLEVFPQEVRHAVTLTNTATETERLVPVDFERGDSPRGPVANVLAGTGSVEFDLEDPFRYATYSLELRASFRGSSIVAEDRFTLSFVEPFDDERSNVVDADSEHWSIRNGRLVGNVVAAGTWSEARLNPAFKSHLDFELTGRAVIGTRRDPSGRDDGRSRQALAIVVGQLFTVVICDGYRNAVSVILPGEKANPSAGGTDPTSVTVRTERPLEYGRPFRFRIRKETRPGGTRVLVWLNGVRVRARVVDLKRGIAFWSPAFRVLRRRVAVDEFRVAYVDP